MTCEPTCPSSPSVTVPDGISRVAWARVPMVNAERLRRLKNVRRSGNTITAHTLVSLFVEPYAFELLKPWQQTCYIPLLAQLYATQWGRDLYAGNKKRTRELNDITSLLVKKLAPMAVADAHLKLQFMGRQTICAVAEWHDALRLRDETLDEATLRWRSDVLIDFLVSGLSGSARDTRPFMQTRSNKNSTPVNR